MAPPSRSASLDVLRAAFDAQAALVVGALADADRAAPTACAGWDVAALDRHLGAIVARLAGLIAHPCDRPADTTVAQWAARLPGLAALADADARTDGPGLAAAVPALQEALATASPTLVVEQRTGRHPLRDALLFRVLELVVHGRDLPQPVAPDRAALKVAVRTMADLLAEVAPGRHVEVRVPPYAAVQCVEGPRHTRGTPPNVVEADPVAFVELCAGRVAWPDVARDGRVRTWGDRADLSPWLPLLA